MLEGTWSDFVDKLVYLGKLACVKNSLDKFILPIFTPPVVLGSSSGKTRKI